MNAIALAFYASAAALVVGLGGLILERGLTGLHLPSRGVWAVALGLSVGLPMSWLWHAAARGDSGVKSAMVGLSLLDAGVAGGDPGEGVPGMRGLPQWMEEWRTPADRTLAAIAVRLPAAPLAPSSIVVGWGASSALAAAVLLLSMMRLASRARKCRDAPLLGRKVRLSIDLGPATVGWFSPRIVVPEWTIDLPVAELELILRHEEEHIRARDTLLLALGLLGLIACPWNPIVWWQMRRLRAAVELDCDRRVLRNGVVARAYGELLFRLGCRGGLAMSTPSLVGSKSLLERRLTMMSQSRGKAALPAAVASMVAALLLTAVACNTDGPSTTEGGADPAELESTPATRSSQAPETNVVPIRVDAAGRIRINGVDHELAGVPAAVSSLDPATTVVRFEADPKVPYGVLATLQDHLRNAGLLRVVFSTMEAKPDLLAAGDPSRLPDNGNPVLLPEAVSSEVEITPRNLLFLEVLPTGMVAARRGESLRAQEIAPRQVETVLRRWLAANPQLIVVVQTHADAAYGQLQEVLDAITAAKVERFSLQVVE